MIKKLAIFLLVISILLSQNILAETQNFTLTSSYLWLNKSLSEKSWNGPIDEISLGILSLKSGNQNIQQGINKLKELRSEDGSWNSNIYDTSWGIYAFYKTGNDYSKSLEWLLSKQVQATIEGNWYIQIKTPYSGICSVTQGTNNPVDFEIVNGSILNCNSNEENTWIDLQYCAGFNIGLNETVSVNCNNLGNTDISLLYQKDNNYYILDSRSNTRFATFDIDNGYFGDFESTAYASWVLTEMNKKNLIYTIPYLRSHLRDDDNNNFDRALLLLVTSNKVYADYLRDTQNNLTGFWDNGNVYNSAFILYSLKKQYSSSTSIEPGLNWLKGEQYSLDGPLKGSWDNGEIRPTAMAVYAINGGATSTSISTNTCKNGKIDSGEECDESVNNTCSNNKVCQSCKCKTSTSSCTSDSDCGNTTLYQCSSSSCLLRDGKCKINSDCAIDEYCDTKTNTCKKEQSPAGCTSDASCGPGMECISESCVEIFGWCASDDECTENERCVDNLCEKKSNSWLWLVSIGLILILGALFFFIKKKGGIRLKSKKSIEPPRTNINPSSPFINARSNIPNMAQKTTMPPPSRNYVDEKLEKDLDNSIKKAKELMGKK